VVVRLVDDGVDDRSRWMPLQVRSLTTVNQPSSMELTDTEESPPTAIVRLAALNVTFYAPGHLDDGGQPSPPSRRPLGQYRDEFYDLRGLSCLEDQGRCHLYPAGTFGIPEDATLSCLLDPEI
jgi:hypothetical protein